MVVKDYRIRLGAPEKVNKHTSRAVVVAQLVERLLPTPEIYSLIPDIGKILSTNCTIEKTKLKKKRLGMDHLLKKQVAPKLP